MPADFLSIIWTFDSSKSNSVVALISKDNLRGAMAFTSSAQYFCSKYFTMKYLVKRSNQNIQNMFGATGMKGFSLRHSTHGWVYAYMPVSSKHLLTILVDIFDEKSFENIRRNNFDQNQTHNFPSNILHIKIHQP